MGKADQKVEGERYAQWKAQQILAQARERDRAEQAQKDKFKFWKTAEPEPSKKYWQTQDQGSTTAAPPPTPPPPPPTGIVAPSQRDEPTKKAGVDKLKFWKKTEKPDTTVMIKDFQIQHDQPKRKKIEYKAPLRVRIGHALTTKVPRVNLLGCKLTMVIILIVVIILLIIFVPIALKIAKFAI
eukprot:Phypoly_transcript_20028.p1 GENE.Phypoly_transcript_20028~~Phypoly_transcript_20028.p1  ORF type:complete len:208 (+),score=37.41 Phypoly_transcript_20028:76-624(+)